jgi:hypothetical protein
MKKSARHEAAGYGLPEARKSAARDPMYLKLRRKLMRNIFFV